MNEFENNPLDLLASVEAEQNIIGGLLLEPTAMAKCRNLTAEKFYQVRHRIIFAALKAMAAENMPIDVVTAHERLENIGEEENAGGMTYLIELAQNTPSAANIRRYVEIIENRHTERELLKLAGEVEKIALSRGGESVAEKCAAVSAAVSAINQTAKREETNMSYAEAAADMLNYMTEMNERDGALIGIPTGLQELDRKTGGMQDGNLIVIAARPSMGKTVLAENIARNAAKLGKKVHFQSYEMVQREIVMRGAAAEMGIDFGNMKQCQMTRQDYDKLGKFTAQLGRWNLSIDTAILSVEEISLMAADKKLNNGLDLLIIDHLHLVKKAGRESEVQELGRISTRLKQLAMELKIPVILVAQLNRAVAKQGDKRPTMADIRGSGTVEQDANIIIMPHREVYYDNQANPHEAELIIAKNRDGEMGTVVCGFEGNHARFVNEPNPWQPPKKQEWHGYAD